MDIFKFTIKKIEDSVELYHSTEEDPEIKKIKLTNQFIQFSMMLSMIKLKSEEEKSRKIENTDTASTTPWIPVETVGLETKSDIFIKVKDNDLKNEGFPE